MSTLAQWTSAPVEKPVFSIGSDSLGRSWFRVECATCSSGAIEGRDRDALGGMRQCLICETERPIALAGTHAVTLTLKAERARTLAEIHEATCRPRRQGLVCSTCGELNERAVRLARAAGEVVQ